MRIDNIKRATDIALLIFVFGLQGFHPTTFLFLVYYHFYYTKGEKGTVSYVPFPLGNPLYLPTTRGRPRDPVCKEVGKLRLSYLCLRHLMHFVHLLPRNDRPPYCHSERKFFGTKNWSRRISKSDSFLLHLLQLPTSHI